MQVCQYGQQTCEIALRAGNINEAIRLGKFIDEAHQKCITTGTSGVKEYLVKGGHDNSKLKRMEAILSLVETGELHQVQEKSKVKPKDFHRISQNMWNGGSGGEKSGNKTKKRKIQKQVSKQAINILKRIFTDQAAASTQGSTVEFDEV